MATPARVFGNRLMVAGALAAPGAVAALWEWVSPWAALAAVAPLNAPALYGTLRANATLFGPVVTHFEPAGDAVWLTIDDGPSPADTPELLDLLDNAGARATFFVRGDRAAAHADRIVEICRRGHQLGNHTFSHPQATFWCLPPWRVRREIERCNRVLREITGQTPRLFRAPVGMANPFVHAAVAALGMRLVGWSARGYDGRAGARAAEVVTRICRDLRPGGIALLHEGRVGRKGEAVSVRSLRLLLAALKERGWPAVLPAAESLR